MRVFAMHAEGRTLHRVAVPGVSDAAAAAGEGARVPLSVINLSIRCSRYRDPLQMIL
jgi:hypothetical protein